MRYLLFLEFIGTTELLLVLLVALVVFGPRKLPEMGRSLGQALNQLRSASDDFKRTWEVESRVTAEARTAQTGAVDAVTREESALGNAASCDETQEVAREAVESEYAVNGRATVTTPEARPAEARV